MAITGEQFIGSTRSAKGSETFVSKRTNAKFNEVTFEEIDEAAKKASDAFIKYRDFPGSVKATFLEHIASAISSSRDVLLDIGCKETGLPAGRLDGEINRTINQINMFADLLKEGSWVNAIIDTAQPDRLPLPKADIRQMQKPVGVIAVFGASNFPFAFSVAGGDTVSALAAGCTVVYKSHPGHPGTSELVAEIIIKVAKDNGIPDGVFSLVQSIKNESAIKLVMHPLIKAIAFTGSFGGGKAILDAAMKREEPVPVYAEMGSTNPVFILPEILQQKRAEIAKSIAASNTLSTGQFCTNPGIIVLNESKETEAFLNNFSDCITDALGDEMLTDSIFKSYNNGIKKLLDTKEVRQMGQGKKTEKENAVSPYMFVTSASDFISQKQLSEEVFGPSSVHVISKNKNELLEIADNIPGQLTVTVWGTENDLLENKELLSCLELKAGRIVYNGVPTGVEVTAAMMHGGPYPATTHSKFTSVGTNAIYRFTRPVCYQNCPQNFLPEALKNENPFKMWRLINNKMTNESV